LLEDENGSAAALVKEWRERTAPVVDCKNALVEAMVILNLQLKHA